MKKRNSGYDAEDVFSDAMKKIKSFCYKLTDSKEVKGRAAVLKPVPADFIVAQVSGVFPVDLALVEVKSCSDPASFGFDQLRPMQRLAVAIFHKLGIGDHYWVAIYSVLHQGWFLISATDIENNTKKSIKWSDMPRFTALEDLINRGK